jgi:hypothetical protein
MKNKFVEKIKLSFNLFLVYIYAESITYFQIHMDVATKSSAIDATRPTIADLPGQYVTRR